MYGKVLKAMKRSPMTNGFWVVFGDKIMMILHKAIIDLSHCNTMIFIIYLPVFQDIYI